MLINENFQAWFLSEIAASQSETRLENLGSLTKDFDKGFVVMIQASAGEIRIQNVAKLVNAGGWVYAVSSS